MVELFSNQLRQVVRRLLHAPMFTLVTLLTVAIGVGANIAVFSVVEGVLLKPLPYPHAEKLVGLWHKAPALHLDNLNMAPSNYFIYREQNHSFTDIGLYQGDSVSVTGQTSPEQVRALDVTDGLLPVLGVPPMLGRWFSHADDAPGSPNTILLSYGYWQRRFGGSRSVLGQNLKVDGKLRQIIGVMPQSFRFLDWEQPELFLPLQLDRNKTTLGEFSYEGMARLRPSVTQEAANRDVARMIPTVWGSFPPPPGFSLTLFKQLNMQANVRPLRQDVVGDVGSLLWILMGSIGVVLLIACANVANLLLVRAEGRHQELAVCSALGASRARIAGEFLLESFVIGLAGSALGLTLAWGALRLLIAMAPEGLPRVHDIGIDLPGLAFTAGVALLCSLLFGCIPALRYASARPGTGMREGGRTLSQGRERHRTRNILVVVQVSLAFVLLICSGLMIRTFRALTHVAPGYDTTAPILTLHIDIPEAEIPDPVKVVRTQSAILDKLAAIPSVTSAALANSVPMDGGAWHDPVYAQDRNYTDGSMPALRLFKFYSPGMFRTLGIPLVAGRDFTWTDTYDKLPVAIVSENFAREYWGSAQKALGRRIRVSTKDDWREVIGVAGDVHDEGMSKDAPTIAYWPIMMNHFESNDVQVRRYVMLAIRGPLAGSQGLMNQVRQAVWSVDANLPLADVHPLDYYYTKSMARTSFTLAMLGVAAGMALLLGIVGLYGVIAYSASQRRREIGIRIALGAQRNRIIGMFVQQGLVLTAAGIVCGILVALAVTRLLSSLLFHVSPIDPITYGCACLALSAAAALASYIPSRRTTAVDPVEALRAE
ncbi:ABC transporter permease [Paracidobacterium acidisoli]|uniref:ABC transporter permease n=1 Tax=Paracidobacterium acidisoli TaxID=2303751 RepID=UPI0026BCD837